ncbi:cyclin-D3-1-like [Apium graveolens]|uniref:cyclin-D3-1-like n=1 Tax=Apium graveolens TaxID=4045 RepID=UPI003D7B54BA
MAILEPNNGHDQQETQSLSLESLLCEEEDAFESLEQETSDKKCNFDLVKEDLSWEDEELVSMFSREKQTHVFLEEKDHAMVVARRRAIEWMLKVKAYFGFSCLTTFLAINYLDRFLCSFEIENDKPWMMHIVAISCLFLAAKIEETKVPTLLDLQVVNSNYIFEAKAVRRMEVLVMSTLKWRMNPVTPFSFLDHIIRRLGLKSDLHWVFFRKCEALFLSAVCDGRFVRYLPSVLAASTMLHVIHQVEPSNAVDYQNQLFGVLKITKENLSGCYELIGNISNTSWIDQRNSHKRSYEEIQDTKNETVDVY